MNNIADVIKKVWAYIQDLMDVRGDVVMMAMSCAFIFRVVYAAFNRHPGLNGNEAAMYASAIAAFSYSNKGTPKT